MLLVLLVTFLVCLPPFQQTAESARPHIHTLSMCQCRIGEREIHLLEFPLCSFPLLHIVNWYHAWGGPLVPQ